MATTTANISVSSNILRYPISINNSMIMKKAGSCHGLDETSGLNSTKVESVTAFKLFGNVGYGEDLGAATIETIGRLYGGNWMLIPWDAVAATTHDIYAKSSTAEPMHIEYMAFIE